MINLNDSQFDNKSVTIFNNGVSGIVNNVNVTVVKKTAEDKDNAPDYKLRFTDDQNATTDMAFYHITAATDFKTVDQQIVDIGKKMKHVLHAFYGKDYQLPNFASKEEMLNGCMKLIHEAGKTGTKFRVFTNYGSSYSAKQYLQIRSWIPFMEVMTTPVEETVLIAGKVDQMEKITANSGGGTIGAAKADDLLDANEDW